MYKVVGLRDTQRRLRKMDREATKKLRVANKVAAEVIKEEAQPEVPVQSGKLKRSLGVKASQTSASVKAGTKSTVPYGNPAHWGWQRRPQGGYNPKNMFLWRAFREGHDEMVEVYEKAMDDARKSAGA
jgi:HK97 gp10 family phage protein